MAGHRRESTECQTQQSGFIRKQSGAAEGFSTGEGSDPLRLLGRARLEAVGTERRPSLGSSRGLEKECGARCNAGQVDEIRSAGRVGCPGSFPAPPPSLTSY